jgi:hypothetical protein
MFNPLCYTYVVRKREKGQKMKYRKDTIQTELYRVAWDYVTGEISWATVKYMRESILARYEETREEMMKIWKQKLYTCYRVVYLTTPY